MTELKAGDILEISCPAGSAPIFKEGDVLPTAEKIFVVVRVQDQKMWLGPLKAGEFRFAIPCSNNQMVPVEISLKLPQKMPEKESPLGLWTFRYPSWFWIALALAIAAMIAMGVGIYQKLKPKKKKTAGKPLQKPVPTAEERFLDFLRSAEKQNLAGLDDPGSVERLYSQGYDGLRSFLEQKLAFKASWATTTEYLGTLKTALMGAGSLRNLGNDVEILLHQADLVRFSKEMPTHESRQKFLKSLREISTKFPRVKAGV